MSDVNTFTLCVAVSCYFELNLKFSDSLSIRHFTTARGSRSDSNVDHRSFQRPFIYSVNAVFLYV